MISLLTLTLLAAAPVAPTITDGLPWKFDAPVVSTGAPHAKSPVGEAASRVSWAWRSARPISRDKSGSTFLSFHLDRYEYADEAAATAAVAQFVATADSNTGHSYAWDFLIADGRHVWWLGAPCLWSSGSFHKLRDNWA